MKATKSTPDTLEVLHEDNHIIVVNKKSGDIVSINSSLRITVLQACVKQQEKSKSDARSILGPVPSRD